MEHKIRIVDTHIEVHTYEAVIEVEASTKEEALRLAEDLTKDHDPEWHDLNTETIYTTRRAELAT